MNEPYLIIHKMRGQTVFDIAYKLDVLGGERWIDNMGLPVTPYFKQPLYEIVQNDLQPPTIPSDWPDDDKFWATKSDGLFERRATTSDAVEAAALLTSLGLKQTKPVLRRL